MTDDNIEIEIEADPPIIEQDDTKKDDDAVADLKGQLEKMQAETAEAKAARQRAEADAEAARQEAARARDDIAGTQYDAVTNALDAAKAEEEAAASEYQAAFEAGDAAKLTEAQRKLNRATAKIDRLEAGKAEMEAQAEQAKKAPARPADPAEAYIAKHSPRAQAWLREHRDCVTDGTKNKRLIAAHYEAAAEGHAIDSDAYFDFIEQKLGYKGDRQDKARTTERRAPGAPVTRDTAVAAGNLTGTKVKLTAGEARAAVDGTHVWNHDDPAKGIKKGEPIGTREFARRKAMMTQQGHYDRTFAAE